MSIEMILLIILLIIVVGYGIYRLFAPQPEYEYTEDYLNNIAEYRDTTLSTIASFIQTKYWHGSANDPKAPEMIPLQSGPETSLVAINLEGSRTISFEVDWSTGEIYFTAQKMIEDSDAGLEIITHKMKLKLQNGSVVDFKPIAQFLEQFESKICDIAQLPCNELLDLVMTSEELQTLTPEQRSNLLFSVVFDMADVITKGKRCSRKRMNIMMSRLFTYVMGNYKEELTKYLNEKKEL